MAMMSYACFLQSRVAPKLEFSEFLKLLAEEVEESGGELEFTEEEAWELYNSMDDELTVPDETNGLSGQFQDEFDLQGEEDNQSGLNDQQKQMAYLMKSMGMDASDGMEGFEEEDDESDWLQQDEVNEVTSAVGQLTSGTPDASKGSLSNNVMSAYPVEGDPMVAELKAVLEGMPATRIRKVALAFRKTLGYPSLLTLTPILRENMPERVTSAWLKRKNTQNASFVMKKAVEDGLADVHMMNGMLQVECSTGSIDRALACHEARFKLSGVQPNQYSDRLVLQMLVENHRHSRALTFKEKVEASGRTLDVLSYGSLIEYYAKNRHVGSALMMLKECVSVHGSPPGEHSLNALRRLCRHQDLTQKTELVNYAGPDPLEWLREGGAIHKREYSKKGRRDVLLPRNKSVDI